MQGSRLRDEAAGCSRTFSRCVRVQVSGFGVQGSGFRVQGLGFEVESGGFGAWFRFQG